MRLLIVTQYFPPEMGAPQARLSELAERAVKRGHQVYVLTAMPNYPIGKIHDGYGGFFKAEIRNGVRVLRSFIIPTQRAQIVPRMISYMSFVISSLLVGITSLPRLDVLITESPPLFLGITGYLLSRLKLARWVFNVSDLWPDSAVHLGVVKKGLALEWAYRLEAWCYRNAWLVSGQSREILDSIRTRFPETRTYRFSNSVNNTLFSPMYRSQETREWLGTGKSCVAVYAGLHGVAQGLNQLLEAAARLCDLEDLVIVLVGNGPERARLIDRACSLGVDNVRFLSQLPREAMPGILASADMAIVPLKTRIPGAVPSKLYEAMGSGLPVVLVAEGEPADIVKRTQCGVVVSPGDIKGLSYALRTLALDSGRRMELGSNGRRAAENEFDRKIIIERFINYLESNC